MSWGDPVRNGLSVGIGTLASLTSSSGIGGIRRPTMSLNFLTTTSLDSRITFSRGTGATRVNASGFIETVGNNVPRFDYDPVTLAARGLLIEEQRTNLLTYSEQFDNAAWTKNNVTIAANSTTAPDGTMTADTLDEGTATANHAMFSGAATLVSGLNYAASIYLKAGSARWVQIPLLNATFGSNAWANFDLVGGAVGNTGSAVVSATITSAGNGWYRCVVVAPATASGSGASLQVGFTDNANSATRLPSYTGSSKTVFAWGAQLEAGAFATSYIPTVASQVTRNADVATMTGTNFSSWYNQNEGTFVVEALAANGLRSGSQGLFSVNDGTTSNVMNAARLATGLVRFNGTGTPAGDVTSVGAASNSVISKTASAYKVNDWALSLNGATVVTDTSAVVPTVTRLGIGSLDNLFDAAAQWGGHIRTLAYYNTRLSNSQLQTLTAPSLSSTLSLDFINGAYNVGF